LLLPSEDNGITDKRDYTVFPLVETESGEGDVSSHQIIVNRRRSFVRSGHALAKQHKQKSTQIPDSVDYLSAPYRRASRKRNVRLIVRLVAPLGSAADSRGEVATDDAT